FDDPLLGQSAVDRFKNNAYDLVIEGESYRPRLKPDIAKDGPPPPAGQAANAAPPTPTRTSLDGTPPPPAPAGASGLDASPCLWHQQGWSSGSHLDPSSWRSVAPWGWRVASRSAGSP